MKKKVYIESSVISYLAARPARDILLLAKQVSTRAWWEGRDRYEIFISGLVVAELADGDPTAARLRLLAVQGLPELPVIPEVDVVANHLIRSRAVPETYRADAAHIALASVHGMNYLLTWNQAHIANPARMTALNDCIVQAGYRPPLFVRPDDFPEVEDVEEDQVRL